MNEILLDLDKSGCKVVAYADDVAIAASGKFPNIIRDNLQFALNKLARWARSSGLGVNPNKTELVLFTKDQRIPQVDPPRMNGTELTFSESAKYLGLILDRKLTFKLNVLERIRKANVALYSCKKAIGGRWGLSPKIVHWIYTAVVRPILLYGVVVWWTATRMKYITNLLMKVQRTACISITGALRTTATDALQVLLHLLPIDAVARKTATSAAIRLKCLSLWKCRNYGHMSILQNSAMLTNRLDYIPSVYTFERNFVTNIPDREEWSGRIPGEENSLHFYTDGSKLNGKVGFGIHCKELNLDIAHRLPDTCSVYQAEVMAIREVAIWLSRNVVTNIGVIIYTDSQAAIRSLEATSLNSQTALDCRRSLNEMAQQFNIHLIWVPGHRDIPGNCKADELARMGTTLQILDEFADIGAPLSTCKLWLMQEAIETSNKRWFKLGTCKVPRQIWPRYDLKRSSYLLSLNRKNLSTLVAVLTGHCLIGEHAKRLGIAYNDFCRSCRDEEEIESVEHLLCHCSAHSRRRLSVLGSAFLGSLTDLASTNIRCILDFINQTGWFR